jgi:magnesium transporter
MDTSPNYKIKKSYRQFGPNECILLLPEIKEFISSKRFNELKELLKRMHSIDIAEGWQSLEPQEKILTFKLLSLKKAVEVFEDLVFDEQSHLINNLDNAEVGSILNEMAPDERVRLFKDLSPKVHKKMISLMKKEEVDDLTRLLTFKENSAGNIMTTEFVSLRKEMTAKQALIRIQESQKSANAKSIYSVYITDDERHLLGSVSLQALLAAPPDILLRDIMSDTEFVKVSVDEHKEEVATRFSRYDLLDAPVVNAQGQLIGIITIDDVVDLIHRQTTREIYEIGKMEAGGGEEIRYARANVSELVRRRAGWLILLLVFDFLTGTVLKTFEHALSSVVALAFFIPMLLDTGGNAGAQTSITIIRGLATGDVTFKNIWRVAKLEIITALYMGCIVGTVAFLRAVLLQQDFALSIVVALTMFSIVLLAIFTGISLPFISKRVGLDPAVLAGPITTSVVDIIGLIIYFKIAQLFLPVLR